MNEDVFINVVLHNVLSDKYGRMFIGAILADCGIDFGTGFSFRDEKTAHEFGLDLLHKIMYNEPELLKKLISDNKLSMEVGNDRGNNKN